MKTYLPLFTGFYGSHWDDPCFDGEDEHYDLPSDRDFCEFVDWDAYHDHIAKEMCSEVESLLEDFVLSITFECIRSPKFYNFENDAIHCDIEFDRFKVEEYLHENMDKFKDYVRDRYTSRDGFTSFYSNDAFEFLEGWHEDTHKVGAVLEFICTCEGHEEPWDLNDCHISLFYTDEINQYANS